MGSIKEDMQIEDEENSFAGDGFKLRPIHCELNPLTRPDGSVMFAQGETCVLAAMLGPVEVPARKLNTTKVYVECIYRAKAGFPTIEDKVRERVIKGSCESALITALHPCTKITIQVQEMENSCGLDACAINAACLALLIGGVPMKFTIAAIHTIVDKDGKIVVDPDRRQELDKRADFVFVFDSLDKNLVAVNTEGSFQMEQFDDAECISRTASEVIFKFYRKTITKFHSQSLLTADIKDNKLADITVKEDNEPMES